jgi:hypothetical protein
MLIRQASITVTYLNNSIKTSKRAYRMNIFTRIINWKIVDAKSLKRITVFTKSDLYLWTRMLSNHQLSMEE